MQSRRPGQASVTVPRMWTRWCEAESGVKRNKPLTGDTGSAKGCYRPGFLNCHLRAIGKEQVNASHLQLVIEQRGLVAANFYFGVDQTVIIRSHFFDGAGCDGAIAQSQI